ncbi:hypothetical protein TKK_0008059 [Trichogramma kaykai]
MAETISALLSSWGLKDLLDIFQKNNVTVQTLVCLSPNDPSINLIVPDFGRRIIFIKKLADYQASLEELDQSEDEELDEFGDIIIEKSGHLEFLNKIREINWSVLIESSASGLLCLDYNRLHGDLSEHLYSRLMIIVGDELIKCLSCFVYETLEFIADKPVGVFGTIEKSTLFVHPKYIPKRKNKRYPNPRGKLWDMYRKNVSILKKTNINTRGKTDKRDAKRRKTDLTDPEKSHTETSYQWLKDNSDSTDWKLIEMYWSNTLNDRMDHWKNEDNSDHVFSKFPVLKQPRGFRLLTQDFAEIFHENNIDIHEKWPIFASNLIILMRDIFNTAAYVNEMNELSTNSVNEKAAVILSLLPALVPVQWAVAQSVPTKTKLREQWRPTAAEGRKYFIIRGESVKRFSRPGVTEQPVIAVVGMTMHDIQAAYVCVDDHIFMANDVLNALDVCFKVIHVLNLDYAPECQPSWMFLQHKLYNMKTDFDESHTITNRRMCRFEKLSIY